MTPLLPLPLTSAASDSSSASAVLPPTALLATPPLTSGDLTRLHWLLFLRRSASNGSSTSTAVHLTRLHGLSLPHGHIIGLSL